MVDFVIGIIFLIFAYLQLNDPDSMVWFVLYFIHATISIGLLFQRLKPVLLSMLVWSRWVTFILFFGWSCYFWPWSEEVWREVGGLAIVTIWAVFRSHFSKTTRAAHSLGDPLS